MRAMLQTIGMALLTIWLAVSLVFVLLRLLPGDAIQAQFAQSGATSEMIDARRAELGLDLPMTQQYLHFWHDLLRVDLGVSLYGGETVVEILTRGLASTLPLASLSLLFALSLGCLLGIWASSTGYMSGAAAFLIDLSIGVPVYWTATIALYVIAARLGSLQTGLLLPVIVLGFHTAGTIAQVTAIALNDARSAPHVRTAAAKGLSQRMIWWRHMLRNAMIVILPVIALQTGTLFSGTVLTEVIFQRAGLGLLLLDGVLARNYPVVQGIVIVVVLVYIAVNAVATTLATLIDPRLRAV